MTPSGAPAGDHATTTALADRPVPSAGPPAVSGCQKRRDLGGEAMLLIPPSTGRPAGTLSWHCGHGETALPAQALALVPLAAVGLPLLRHPPKAPVPQPAGQGGPVRTKRQRRPPPAAPFARKHGVGVGMEWGPTKTAVEFMVWSGELASTRRAGGQRLFGLAERSIPAEFLNDGLTDGEWLTRLLSHAGTVLGVATVDDLADFLRIPAARSPSPARHRPPPPRTEGLGQAWVDPGRA
ncbi:DNA glycosylase AlkZ-like family protein [Streptomyces xanthophaeus]